MWYEEDTMKTTFSIKGMHCESCKTLIEEVCNEIEGVTSSNVNFKTGKVDIEHTKPLDKNNLKKEIKSLGDYEVIGL